MLLTKEVEVKPTGKMIKYYRDKGYDAKHKQLMVIKVEDLPEGSFIPVDVLCDYCKKEIFSIRYYYYCKEAEYINKHACRNCWQKKAEEVVIMKYGVKNVAKLKEIQEKREKTLQERYGVSNPLKSEEIKNKLKQTMLNVYGVDNISQLEEIKEQKAQTTLKHFGVRNPAKSEEVKAKMRNRYMENYGVGNPNQLPEIKAKTAQTLYKRGATPTSRQQFYLFNLYKSTDPTIELNYPISHYNADICLPNEKIDIEVDFGGHNLSVKTGKLTQEEFDQKEIIRNNIIKREGYKQIRIKSSKDLLPSDHILLQMLSEAKQYFSLYPNHSWIEFSIDTSTVRNAEHKDGIPYSFGELRKIKDSDLPNNTNINNQNLKGA